jgi:hypothetical protein
VLTRERVAAGSVKETETMLGYTKLITPFDGIVTRKLADVGDLAAPGKPIIEMEDPGALRFEADVPEALIGHLKLGDRLPVRVGAEPAPVEGMLVEMAPIADAANRTFLVKLDLPPDCAMDSSAACGSSPVTPDDPRSAAAVVARGQMDTVFVAAEPRLSTRPHRQTDRQRSRTAFRHRAGREHRDRRR